ncbi:MAG TPA: ABC transporter permease [Pyrinomonadaceae bacterium]|nr:ABC transporter permease [Pyrinomonadaceae bacterium]
MHTLWQDLRYGARMLLKNPGITAIAVLTLALGIGANTAIFSVVNAVMLRPLPYNDPDRLVALWEDVPGKGRWRVAPAVFFDWKNQNTVFEDIAAYGAATLTLTGSGEPEQLLGTGVSAGYFHVIGREPFLGRSFLPQEYEPGKGHVVILGHAFWQGRFGGDQSIVGKTITLNDANFIVIGVMPPGIYPAWPTTSGQISFDRKQQQFLIPMSFSAQWAAVRTAHVLGVLGRLKPGITIAQAQTEMDTIAARLGQEYKANKGEGIIVSAFMDEMAGDVRPALLMLLGAVGLVLLVACANIAGLLMAQYAARSKEIGIRVALGAGRMRLLRQFFLESLLLSLLGTVAGIALARFGIDLILKFMQVEIARLNETQLDLRVLGFTIGLSLITCLLFGLLPAWQASKPNLQTALEQGERTSGPGGLRLRLRQSLVVLQIAMAVMLVIGAGLLMKSFWQIRQVDPGFIPENVVSLTLTLPESKYKGTERINRFFDELIEQISALPGVEGVAIAYDHPLEANWVDSFTIEGRAPLAPGESQSGNFHPVSWDYFRTIGAQLISGRQFTVADDQDHPGVAIVNQAFVRRYFPHENPIGQRINPNPPARIWKNERLTSFEIVGIVRDVKSAGLQAEPEPTYYLPASQAPYSDMTVLARTRVEPRILIPAIRHAVWSIDPSQPISNVRTMEKILADSIAQPRLSMLLMGLFGVLALILASVGIYGLLSYAVTLRRRELGIRLALGAQARDVLKLILRQGMALAIIGIAVGLIGSFALTRVIRTLLFGVTPTDGLTFVLVTGVLALVALFACYIPARRATKVDPMMALRDF